jgi:hypothetical protein
MLGVIFNECSAPSCAAWQYVMLVKSPILAKFDYDVREAWSDVHGLLQLQSLGTVDWMHTGHDLKHTVQ